VKEYFNFLPSAQHTGDFFHFPFISAVIFGYYFHISLLDILK